ncbi:MAG: hypothetical protein GYA24_15960 [Candidatus Lokiarchaeota archaeon]|nr:hypothetical protein [Candidatus Lokiarchaeota archaeon]
MHGGKRAMIKVSIKPIFRDQAIIQLPQGSDLEIEAGRTYIVVSAVQQKPFSFLAKVLEIASTSDTRPVLEVDSRKAGPLAEGDEVDLFPYNIPAARKLVIAVPDKYKLITQGNWTSTFQPVLHGNLYDAADDLNVAVNVGNAVQIVQGIALESDPKFPVSVGDGTTIEVRKLDKEKLDAARKQAVEHKATRAKAWRDSQQTSLKALLGKLKAGAVAKAKRTIEFSGFSSVKALSSLIHGLTSGLEEVECSQEESGGVYTAHHACIVREELEPTTVIEFQVSSQKGSGVISLLVFARDASKAEKLASDLLQDLARLQSGLKGKIEIATVRVSDADIQAFILDQGSKEPMRPLAKIAEIMAKEHPDWRVDAKRMERVAKEMDKRGLISTLERMDTGFYMVHFLPPDVMDDPLKVLALAETRGVLSKSDIMAALSWPEARASNALDFLEKKGLAKRDKSYIAGVKYYFPVTRA